MQCEKKLTTLDYFNKQVVFWILEIVCICQWFLEGSGLLSPFP